MNALALLNGLRFVDSFFPAGGFAFSSGLEAAVQAGQVRNAEELYRYVEDLFLHGTGRCEAVAVRLAHDAVTEDSLSTALTVDGEIEAMKACREARAASRQMGRQLLRVAVEELPALVIMQAFRCELDAGRTPGHLAVSMGLTLASLGWHRQEAIAAFLYQTAVGFVSASYKLLPIGQREGQRLLASWMPLIEAVTLEADSRSTLSSWTPIQDIHAMRHPCLSTRLFRS